MLKLLYKIIGTRQLYIYKNKILIEYKEKLSELFGRLDVDGIPTG